MPKKSVDYLGLSCLTSKFCATCHSPQKNRQKNPTKTLDAKTPKRALSQKNPRNSPWLTGTGCASGCSCSSQKRSLLPGPRTFVVVKVVSPLHVCILHKNNTMAQKWPSKQKKMNSLIGIEDSGSKLDVCVYILVANFTTRLRQHPIQNTLQLVWALIH